MQIKLYCILMIILLVWSYLEIKKLPRQDSLLQLGCFIGLGINYVILGNDVDLHIRACFILFFSFALSDYFDDGRYLWGNDNNHRMDYLMCLCLASFLSFHSLCFIFPILLFLNSFATIYTRDFERMRRIFFPPSLIITTLAYIFLIGDGVF